MHYCECEDCECCECNERCDCPSVIPARNEPHVTFMIGTAVDGQNHINPDNNVTRQETATMFFRIMNRNARLEYWSNENPFTDVLDGHWFNIAVSTTSNAGIFGGTSATMFSIRDISRVEFVAASVRFLALEARGNQIAPLSGPAFPNVPGWAANYVQILYDLGHIGALRDSAGNAWNRYSTFNEPVSRAEAAAILIRLLGRGVEAEHHLAEPRHNWPDLDNTHWAYLYLQEATNSHCFSWRYTGREQWGCANNFYRHHDIDGIEHFDSVSYFWRYIEGVGATRDRVYLHNQILAEFADCCLPDCDICSEPKCFNCNACHDCSEYEHGLCCPEDGCSGTIGVCGRCSCCYRPSLGCTNDCCDCSCNCILECPCAEDCACQVVCPCEEDCACQAVCQCTEECACQAACQCTEECACQATCQCAQECACQTVCQCAEECTCQIVCKCEDECIHECYCYCEDFCNNICDCCENECTDECECLCCTDGCSCECHVECSRICYCDIDCKCSECDCMDAVECICQPLECTCTHVCCSCECDCEEPYTPTPPINGGPSGGPGPGSGPGGGAPGGGVVTPPPAEDDDEDDVEIEDPNLPMVPFTQTHYAYLIGDHRGLIRPRDSITRAEVATIFFRLITDEFRVEMWTQTNPFPDVVLQNWFNNGISTMTNIGLLNGMPNGTFQPTRAITRAEFAAIVSRFVDQSYDGENLFADISGHWAEEYINTVASLGWVVGVGNGSFEPNRNITRAEAATIVNRILVRHPETVDDLLEGMIVWPDNINQSVWYYIDIQEATNSNNFEMKDCGVYKSWTELIEEPYWAALERPNSRAMDHRTVSR